MGEGRMGGNVSFRGVTAALYRVAGILKVFPQGVFGP